MLKNTSLSIVVLMSAIALTGAAAPAGEQQPASAIQLAKFACEPKVERKIAASACASEDLSVTSSNSSARVRKSAPEQSRVDRLFMMRLRKGD